MKRKIAFGFIIVCSITLNIVFVAMWLIHATPRYGIPKHTCRVENESCRKCPLHETLELTDSQWGVLKPAVESYRQMADSLRCEIAVSREAMLAELARTPTDTAALTACRNRILEAQRKMQEQVVANVLEQRKVLTPEQQRRFIEKVRNDMSCAGFPGTTGMTHFQKGKRAATKETCGH